MNSLSWLIYLAEVCGHVGGIFGFGAIVSVIITIIPIGFGTAIRDAYSEGSPDWYAGVRAQKLAICVGVPLSFLFGLIWAVIPSQNTVYAIAASEMGEKFTHTQTFNKAEQALNAWLDRQITPEKKGEQ